MSEARDLRLFLAIEIPDRWRSLLSGVRGQLETAAGNSVKWVRPDLMHVTLVFLGNQPQDMVPAAIESMSAAAAAVPPFPLALGSAGCFGSPDRLRALWVGLREVPPGLLKLRNGLVDHLSRQGVQFDAKALVPHVTLGRTRPALDRDTSRRLHRAMQGLLPLPASETLIDEFRLVQSRLAASGPEYESIWIARLGGSR